MILDPEKLGADLRLPRYYIVMIHTRVLDGQSEQAIAEVGCCRVLARSTATPLVPGSPACCDAPRTSSGGGSALGLLGSVDEESLLAQMVIS